MKSHEIVRNPHFVGRKAEKEKLAKVGASGEAAIVVVYGRRRVGKTELIEQFFRGEFVWKFEGIQPDRKRKKSSVAERQYQIQVRSSRGVPHRERRARARPDSGAEHDELPSEPGLQLREGP